MISDKKGQAKQQKRKFLEQMKMEKPNAHFKKKSVPLKHGRKNCWVCGQCELKRRNLESKGTAWRVLDIHRESQTSQGCCTSLVDHRSAHHVQGNHCSLERRPPKRRRRRKTWGSQRARNSSYLRQREQCRSQAIRQIVQKGC